MFLADIQDEIGARVVTDIAKAGGKASYKGKDLFALEAHERAGEGLFLGFQYPVEIPGVSNLNFLRTALNGQLGIDAYS